LASLLVEGRGLPRKRKMPGSSRGKGEQGVRTNCLGRGPLTKDAQWPLQNRPEKDRCIVGGKKSVAYRKRGLKSKDSRICKNVTEERDFSP